MARRVVVGLVLALLCVVSVEVPSWASTTDPSQVQVVGVSDDVAYSLGLFAFLAAASLVLSMALLVRLARRDG